MSAVSGAGLSIEFRPALLGGREVSESNMFCMDVYKNAEKDFFSMLRATPLPRSDRAEAERGVAPVDAHSVAARAPSARAGGTIGADGDWPRHRWCYTCPAASGLLAHRCQRRSHGIETPTWPAPNTPIPRLPTTTGVGFLRLRARAERRGTERHRSTPGLRRSADTGISTRSVASAAFCQSLEGSPQCFIKSVLPVLTIC